MDSKKRFFGKTFLLANIKSNLVFGISFFTMSNANINFQTQNLHQRSYIIKEMLLTIRKIELIGKKKFIVTALNLNYETFIIYIAAININFDANDEVHSLKKTNETSIEVFNEYADFVNVFSSKLVTKFLKYISISNHTIKLVDN